MANTRKTISKSTTVKQKPIVETNNVIEKIDNPDAIEIPMSEPDEIKDTSVTNILDIINSGVDDVSAIKSSNVDMTAQSNEIPDETKIPCRSVTYGGLLWISPKTGAHYRWNEIGTVETVPYGEIKTMNNTNREFLYTPMIIVNDERVIDYFRLRPVYEKVAQINSLEKIFNRGDMHDVEEALKTIMDVNMREVAISKIRALRKTGKLTNYDVIRKIEKVLCFDLTNDDEEVAE